MRYSDQDLARLCREVFDSRSGADEELSKCLETILQPLAYRLLNQVASLRSSFDPDDLIQGFLEKKILDPKSSRKLLEPIANGQKPIGRLKRSFHNFVVSQSRKRHAKSMGMALDELTDLPSSVDALDWNDAKAILHDQIVVLRNVAELVHAKNVAVLLLTERLWLLDIVRTSGVDVRIEQLMIWDESDQQLQITPTLTIGEVWNHFANQRINPTPIGSREIGEFLGIPANTWDQWKKRARACVIKCVGEPTARKIFPAWPNFRENRGGSRQ
jgi:DNA-directed RNA polymerase specialized sigma24 family protein